MFVMAETTNGLDFIHRDGRKIFAYTCAHCNKKDYKRKDQIAKSVKSFCSIACSANSKKNHVEIPCANCGKPTPKSPYDLKRNSVDRLFCSRSCAASSSNRRTKRGKKHHNYKNGNSSYRAKALRTFEHKCHNKDCLITPQLLVIPVEMLDVDHIDNDRKNNDIDNLVILCVWCHTLKTRNIEVVSP